jgi:hypothetical protein
MIVTDKIGVWSKIATAAVEVVTTFILLPFLWNALFADGY